MNRNQMERIFPLGMGGGTTFDGGFLATTLPDDTATPDATFTLVDEMLKRAMNDATQGCDLRLRWEALAWLWVCCPDIADQLQLPWPEALDVQQKATSYMDRYAAF